jgi:hypothetical protein
MYCLMFTRGDLLTWGRSLSACVARKFALLLAFCSPRKKNLPSETGHRTFYIMKARKKQ